MKFNAEVMVEKGVSAEEIKEMEKVLREINIFPAINDNYYRKSLGDVLPWIIFLYIPIRKFFDAFMAEVGKDCYKILKEKILELYENRKTKNNREGSIIFIEANTRIQVTLPVDQPEILQEALEELGKTDLESFEFGPLIYDRSKKKMEILHVSHKQWL